MPDQELAQPETDQTKPKKTHSPGPWHGCNGGKCVCRQVWSGPGDHPVCKVESGPWGDHYSSLRFTKDGGEAGSINPKIEAYTELIEYGEVDPEVAEMNVHLIIAAPQLLELVRKLEWSYMYEPYGASCPFCKESMLDGVHKEDCQIGQVLAKATGQATEKETEREKELHKHDPKGIKASNP